MASRNTYENRSAGQIEQILRDMATSGADENDITVFYYSGHGADSNAQSMRGALCGVDGQIVPVETVRTLLDRVPGKVVLLLDSCLSGQYIQSKSAGEAAKAYAAYNAAFIAAFTSGTVKKALPDSPVAGKYKILAAAGPLESSWDLGDFGLFTYFAGAGMGLDYLASPQRVDLLADANGDKRVTLAELYEGVAPAVREVSGKIENGAYQNVMVWPANDQTAIVARN